MTLSSQEERPFLWCPSPLHNSRTCQGSHGQKRDECRKKLDGRTAPCHERLVILIREVGRRREAFLGHNIRRNPATLHLKKLQRTATAGWEENTTCSLPQKNTRKTRSIMRRTYIILKLRETEVYSFRVVVTHAHKCTP